MQEISKFKLNQNSIIFILIYHEVYEIDEVNKALGLWKEYVDFGQSWPKSQ